MILGPSDFWTQPDVDGDEGTTAKPKKEQRSSKRNSYQMSKYRGLDGTGR
jgi:hypothetical protein